MKVLQPQIVKIQYFPLTLSSPQKEKIYEEGLGTVASYCSTLFRKLPPLCFVKISMYSWRLLRIRDLRLTSPYFPNLPFMIAPYINPSITRHSVTVQGIFGVQHSLVFTISQVQGKGKTSFFFP